MRTVTKIGLAVFVGLVALGFLGIGGHLLYDINTSPIPEETMCPLPWLPKEAEVVGPKKTVLSLDELKSKFSTNDRLIVVISARGTSDVPHPETHYWLTKDGKHYFASMELSAPKEFEWMRTQINFDAGKRNLIYSAHGKEWIIQLIGGLFSAIGLVLGLSLGLFPRWFRRKQKVLP